MNKNPYDTETPMTSLLWQCGRPVLFLAALCVGLGALFLYLGSETGWVLIVTALATVALFLLLAKGLRYSLSANHQNRQSH